MNLVNKVPQKGGKIKRLLSSKQFDKLIHEWNATEVDYASGQTIHSMFESQVLRTPDALALVYEEVRLSYGELNERSNRLAHYLISRYGIVRDDLVLLCLDRSEHMLISILGVLKAGGAYVPMDPGYPRERITYIQSDTRAKVVLTHSDYAGLFMQDSTGIAVEYMDGNDFSSYPAVNPVTQTGPGDLAYVIYTSGTTGQPKGVMCHHQGIVNRIGWMNSEYPLTENDRIIQKTPYVFDVSVWELFWANWHGAAIVFARAEGHKDSGYLTDLIAREEVSVIHFVPSMLGAFQEVMNATEGAAEKLSTLRYLFCSGEALPLNYVQGAHKLIPGAEVHNLYGPTEASVDVLYYDCSARDLERVLIGRPIANTTVYVLDSNLSPLPVGAIGELYIGGAGVARGYLNREELTRERFIANPFQSLEEQERGYNGRLYKTGDLVRYLSDGNIEYIGRNDFQVKIRGYRIELGEIESRLGGYAGVEHSVVLAHQQPGGGHYLVGYYVSGEAFSHSELHGYLSGVLPDYMVPSAFVHLERLPLTINGKLDRKALPLPELSGGDAYVAPRSQLEKDLCVIYGEVLGLDSSVISIESNFFSLGGNSILAMKLVSRVNRVLESGLSVSGFFAHQRISQLSGYLSSSGEQVLQISAPSVSVAEEQLLSFAQERLWFIDSYEGGSNAYNMPIVLSLQPGTAVHLVRALQKVVERHEVLRSLIKTSVNGIGYQQVELAALKVIEERFTTRAAMHAAMERAVNKVFRLSQEYPIEARLYHLEESGILSSYLSIVIHHIAFDGWSVDVLLSELLPYYRHFHALSVGDESLAAGYELAGVSLQYKEYALWQRSYLSGEVLENQLSYWKAQLSGYETLSLPVDKPRPKVFDYLGVDVPFSIDSATSDALRRVAKSLGVSLYSVLLSGYYLLLKTYSSQSDLVVGATVANRHHHGLEDTIGFFVNTLAMRIEVEGGQRLLDFIARVSSAVLSAQEHQDLPFEKLVDELGISPDASRHPVFQVLFNMDSFADHHKEESDALFNAYQPGSLYHVAKFDLSLNMNDTGDCLKGVLNYATSLFESSTISGYISTYQQVLKELACLAGVGPKDKKVNQLLLVSGPSYTQLIHEWNATEVDYASGQTIHSMFESQVLRTPDALALVYEEVRLSYRELNERSNRLAHYLISRYGIVRDDLVLLCLDRSEHMLISILGVLKAGGAYVPMDPGYPRERITYIQSDTRAKVVLTHSDYAGLFMQDSTGIAVEYMDGNDFSSYPAVNPVTQTGPGDLAYVIYTSGTTGQPKGVMCHHQGIVNRIGWMNSEYPLTENDRIIQKTPYVFDVSVWELFWANWHGAAIVFARAEGHKDSGYLTDLIAREEVSVIHFVPSMLGAFQEVMNATEGAAEKLSTLRYLFCSGEALPLNYVQGAHKLIPGAEVHNLYGPTEASVDVLYYDCSARDLERVLIGRPIANTTVYVLDSNLSPLPVGAIGELYIGGAGVARGYLNREELTRERFIANPFQSLEEQERGYNGRLYKTGDLVRYLSDGNIEYIGRNDFQVKIRGYRIELGEIESRLGGYAGVEHSVVLAHQQPGGGHYLVGYYVSGEAFSHSELHGYLSGVLPDYMVPSAFVHLERLPLTINGKLDRKALPLPELSGGDAYVAPRSQLEKDLCVIYGEMLGLDSSLISVDSNFFSLGGNSILAMKLVSRVNRVLECGLSVSGFFAHQSISQLSDYLSSSGHQVLQISAPSVSVAEEQLLSFAQERLWFIDSYEGGSNAYNMPIVLSLQPGTAVHLVRALQKVVERHEVLRSLIKTSVNGIGYQQVELAALKVIEERFTTRAAMHAAMERAVNKVFRLSQEYPIEARLYHLEESGILSSYLSIVIHHIAFDGWSVDVLLSELLPYYRHFHALSVGDESLAAGYELAGVSLQYKEYALWQRSYLSGEVLENQLSYWKAQLSGYETLSLPADKPRPKVFDYHGADVPFIIDSDTSGALRTLAKSLGVSLYSVLLSGYYLLLKAYSSQSDLVVGTTVSNRHHHGLEDTIGFFVNTLAMRIEVEGEQHVEDFITRVSGAVLSAQQHQDLPFEKLVDELDISPDASRHPVFQVLFNMDSFADQHKEESDALFSTYQPGSLYHVAKFDLSLNMDDTGDCLKGVLNYATSLFDFSTVAGYISSYRQVLKELASLAGGSWRGKKVNQVCLVSGPAYTQIIHEWNATQEVYASEQTIHSMFEHQVLRTPDALALVYEEVRLSYGELNERSNRLAHYLISRYGIVADDLVLLCLDRSEHMLISILGVLKAGGAYVPMDPGYPADRIGYIQKDTRAKVVLTQSGYAGMFEQDSTGFGVEAVDRSDFSSYPSLNPGAKTGATDLAYVIYTSGTTGQPKGVMCHHQGIVNRIGWMENKFPINSADRIIQKTPYIFDVSVFELFWANWHGAAIVFARAEGHKDSIYLSELIAREQVSIIHFVPSMLGAFQEVISTVDGASGKLSTLRYLFCSGEALPLNYVQGAHKLMPGTEVHNLYGPTEASVEVLHYDCSAPDLDRVLIGRPIANTTVYVLDSGLSPLPVGAVGELYIGGAGVARGYLNREELTRERFIANPFQSLEEQERGYNGRLYKTGDLVRYLSDGNIEYIGRNDFQVKIRGYRIELGEIESRLGGYAGVEHSVVLAHQQPGGGHYLVGYYVSGEAFSHSELHGYLSGVLPDYMVPSAFVHLERLPLTINGKLDRKALPLPELSGGDAYVAPRSQLEKDLCVIYGEMLGLDSSVISIESNFFSLGGNSILAMKLVSRVNRVLESGLSVSGFFAHQRISQLSGYLSSSGEQVLQISAPSVSVAEEQLLSFAQERLWFIDSYEGGSNAYNMPIVLSLQPGTAVHLVRALQKVVERHEVLRSLIKTSVNGIGYQQVELAALKVIEERFTTRAAMHAAMERAVNKVFRLSQEYPIEARLYHLEESGILSSYLSIVIHHIAFDGWSVDVLLSELLPYYHYFHALSVGDESLASGYEPAGVSLQYKDYALWQRSYLSGEVLDKQLSYWKDRLSGYETLSLPVDKPRPKVFDYLGVDVPFSIDSATSDALRRVAKSLGVSLYSVLLSGYYLLLKTYSSQSDLVVGATVANRHHHGLEDTIGFFVNTLAMRIEVEGGQRLLDFIARVSSAVLSAQEHQDLPFEKLVDELGISPDASRHPVFQVLFNMDSFADHHKEESDALFNAYQPGSLYHVAKFDLSLNMNDTGDCLKGVLNYATSLFESSTISGYISTYQQVLKELACLAGVGPKDKKVNQLLLVSGPSYTQLIHEWNATEVDYASGQTIHSMFESQVLRTPDALALVYEEVRLSYRELNERSNRLAHYLISRYGIVRDDLVLLCLDRSEHMLISILGVLKAGGAYVPMDPGYPRERITYMLEDTGSRVLITNEVHAGRLKKLKDDKALIIIDGDSEELCEMPVENPQCTVQSTALAYVIYTSGTTGKPKGVMVEHRSVANLIEAGIEAHKLDEYQNVGCYSNYVFDAFVYEAIPPLINGNTIFLYNEQLKNSLHDLADYIIHNHIEVSLIPPAILSEFINRNDNVLKLVFAGGEKFPDLKNQVLKTTLLNEYGPTETTVCASYHTYSAESKNTNIGRPIANTTVYVLDSGLSPLPVGAVGELYIGGAGVARGYLNREELTRERFIANPFQSLEEQERGYNGRLYKTGDLVRYLSDGNIEYIGRNDFQVKIRGYRIELGEIESRLGGYAGVEHSVVLAHQQPGGGHYLVGYYVSGEAFSHSELHGYLSGVLPDYMVPSAFVHLERLPLTINGKLDRKALPLPELSVGSAYVAPGSALEKDLCDIYGEVLGLDSSLISIEADFFSLGGDSIVSIQLCSRIRQRLGFQVSVKTIFSCRTISLLSVYLSSVSSPAVVVHSEQGTLSGPIGFLPIQRWFFDRLDKGMLGGYNHWNQSFLIHVPALDISLLERSVSLLVGYHDMLRAGYRSGAAGYEQFYGPLKDSYSLPVLDVGGMAQGDIEAVFTGWQSGFDIFGGELFRIGYVSGYVDGSARVYFALHHLIVDAVSWRILSTDLERIYNALATGSTVDSIGLLGEKGTSYRQWVSGVSAYGTDSGDIDRERSYWSGLSGAIARSNAALSVYRSEDHRDGDICLNRDYTDRLLRGSSQRYHTQINDILLSALSLCLHDLSGEDTHAVLLEGHGREVLNGEHDISHTVGWFTTVYPVLLASFKEPADTIVAVKEHLRGVPSSGLGYGALHGYDEDGLPQVVFNYLGQFDLLPGGVSGWSLSAESSGLQVSGLNSDHRLLEINGGIIGGELQFRLSGCLTDSSLDLLCSRYRFHLERLIDELSTPGRSYLTRSDIGNIISGDYLNELQGEQELEGVYLANSLQEGFIYHSLHQGDTDDAYIVQQSWRYDQGIDLEHLRQSWSLLQASHGSLRLRFGWSQELVQVILGEGVLDWRYIDLAGLDEQSQDTYLSELTGSDRREQYDLGSGPLFRVYLARLSSARYHCLFSSHHAILDGWSMPLLLGEVHDIYLRLVGGEQVSVSSEAAYGAAQAYLQQSREEDTAYWSSYLSTLESAEDLGSLLGAHARGVRIADYREIREHRELRLNISGDRYEKIKQLGNTHGFTLNALLQYLWHKQLSIYGHSSTTVVGMTVSGRNLPVSGIEDSIGLYINTLPVVLEHRSGSVLSAIAGLQSDINDISGRSSARLSGLQQGIGRLFSSLFVYENYPVSYDQDKAAALSLEFLEGKEKTDYPLNIIAHEHSGSVELKLEYAGELFEEQMMLQLLEGMSGMLDDLLADPGIDTNGLAMVSPGVYDKLIHEWNATQEVYASGQTIHSMFELQVSRTPDALALVYEDVRLSYGELNERSNRLAHYLIDRYGIVADDLVLLCLDRSEHMLISILGVLKAGGAYVPMDPGYPRERITYIQSDTRAKVVLTHSDYAGLFMQDSTGIAVEYMDGNDFSSYPAVNPVTQTGPGDLAYVIYTSGTTGQPKGVMCHHQGIVNRIGWMNSEYPLTENDRIIQKTPYVFDVSVWELFWANWHGAAIVFARAEGHKDSGYLTDLIAREEVSVIHFVPSMLGAFQEVMNATEGAAEKLSTLRYLFCSGEALPLNYVQGAHKLIPGAEVHNLYGPTEASVDVLYYDCSARDLERVLIGRPIANTTVYVLDSNLSPLPVGAIGELYIGGAGVARGYLNREELTRERFIANPFQSLEEQERGYNGRLYKTGDLVRYLSDGNIEYIGRNDFQVKIRGYRIELGEIESRLGGYAGVEHSVVLAHQQPGGGHYLVGYYVSGEAFSHSELHGYLSGVLPDYMVPSAFVHLERLPLTINGKLDRKALPLPELSGGDAYVAPFGIVEAKLCNIYSELLGISPSLISAEADFFELGGESILAIRLMSKINNEFQCTLKAIDIFSARSVRKLAAHLKGKIDKNRTIVPLNQAKTKEPLFMIHPGGGGCEAYIPLAKQLNEYCYCYGIDSYNLNNIEHKSNLHQLALFYLEQIEQEMIANDKQRESYTLLGWSLGGQIALEMAAILEQKGIKNVTVYLLDTFLWEKGKYKSLSEEAISVGIKNYRQQYQHIEDYLYQAEKLIKTEQLLMTQQISFPLKHTQVTLFKAHKQSNNIALVDSEIRIDNGIISALAKPELLQIIEMHNVDHDEILKDELAIISVLKTHFEQIEKL